MTVEEPLPFDEEFFGEAVEGRVNEGRVNEGRAEEGRVNGGRAEEGRAEEDAEEPEEQPGEKGPEKGPSPEHGNRVTDNRGQAVSARSLNGGVHYHEYREYTGEAATRRLRQATRVGRTRVDDILATFCPSQEDRYTAFVNDLRRHSTGVITGDPGTGRATTAIHAMATLRRGTPVQEVVADPDAGDAGLTGLANGSDHSRLLDLTHMRRPTRLQQEAVRALSEQLYKAGALLVVVARPGEWEVEQAEHRAHLRVETPARPVDVFRGTMKRRYGAPHAHRWVDDLRLRNALEGADPVHAIRLARCAQRTAPKGQDNTETELSAWIGRAVDEFSDASAELRILFQTNHFETEFRRVLLQTVAVLEGASRATVVRQAHRLAELWKVPSVWRTPVSGDSLSAHLTEIEARTRGDRVHFKRPRRSADALDYLWREYPEARQSLQEWSWEAALDLPWREKASVARRWCDLAVRHRDPAPVEALIDRWADDHRLMLAAVPAIAESAVSAELGPMVRSRLYGIAISPRSSHSDRMVMEVCRVYGRVQPGTALTRLGHIADKAPDHWERSLVQALEEIAAEQANTALVLDELAEWAGNLDRPRRAGVAAAAVIRILGAVDEHKRPTLWWALRERTVGIEVLVRSWRSAIVRKQVGRSLWRWLDALAEVRPADAQGAVVLLRAAQLSEPFRSLLERSLRRWPHAHERRSPVLDELRRALNEN